jgi:outer membrane protein assembly factor BamB
MRSVVLIVGLLASSPWLIAQSGESGSRPIAATGWPGWGGPHRDFTVDSKGLASSWPPGGPPRLWQRPLGEGHSGIAVDENRLFTLYRPSTGQKGQWAAKEVVAALDAATGRTLWEHEYPASTETMDFGYGSGPHVTPLVVGNRVFAAGTNKQFFALDKATGRVLWSHDLVKDFGAPRNLIRYPVKPGYAPSPLPYKDLVIAMVGGPDHGVMAFRQDDGRPVWHAGSYSDIAQGSPQLIRVDGQTQLLVVSNDGVHGLDPDSGRALWGPVGLEKQYGAHISTPVWSEADQLIFFSAAYDGGSKALKLARTGQTTTVTELWFSNKVRVHFGNVLRIGDLYVASSGDFGPSFLTALDAKSGRVVWQDRSFAKANLVLVDGKVVLIDEDGTLGLIAIDSKHVTVLARAAVASTTSWTAPTLVGTTLYLRDRASIMAFNLGERR